MPEPAPAPVALTCGDPSGIGPEIAVKAWTLLRDDVPFFWIGDPRHLPAGAPIAPIDRPAEARRAAATGLPVLECAFAALAVPGRPAPENASGVVQSIETAISLVVSGQAGAICTLPISKRELADHAGFRHPGHTEFLADRAGVHRAVMMLVAEELRVVPATIHVPLSTVPKILTRELLDETIRTTHGALRGDFGLTSPRIAVAGLNPHAGEGGLMGREEIEVIAPVCDLLRREGLNILGPLPADTMFHARARAGYDAAVAMYHDQALIPIKTLAFDRGVNVTLGLPYIRTSPDHGTAFDIAGRGIADPTSLVEALKLAHRLAVARAASQAA